MAGIKFKKLTGEELITVPDSQFEMAIETPEGLFNIKLDDLMAFILAQPNQRLTDIESTLDSAGLDPSNPRTITVDGDVQGSASLMDANVVLTLNVPDGALSTAKVAGLAATLLGLRVDVNDALDGLTTKLNAADPAVAAQKLVTARQINGVLFDGTQDITVGLTPDQQAALGVDKTYEHAQASPATEWNITHGLGKHPSVTVVDSAGTPVVGAWEYIDLNNMKLTFAGAMAGTAYLN